MSFQNIKTSRDEEDSGRNEEGKKEYLEPSAASGAPVKPSRHSGIEDHGADRADDGVLMNKLLDQGDRLGGQITRSHNLF